MITPIRGRKPAAGVGATVTTALIRNDNPDKGTETELISTSTEESMISD